MHFVRRISTNLLKTPYALLSSSEKKLFIPPPQTPVDFLSKIGRNSIQHSAKFPTWDSLFTTDFKEAGIDTASRKWIKRCLERVRKGLDVVAVEIPKRKKRFLKFRREVELKRDKKKGLI